MNRLLKFVVMLLLTLALVPSALGQGGGWPRTLPLDEGMITIYSLQPDEMKDDNVYFRAALAYRATAGSEPVFGAAWFESPVEIDTSNRIVRPKGLKVTATRFPADTTDVQSDLAEALALQSPAWNLDFSLDELEAALKIAEADAGTALNTAPPEIIYRDRPALLITMDGAPILREIENSPLEAVINTPYPLISDGNHYYLNAARDVWYRADRATGPYRFDTNPPADIVAMINASDAGEAATAPAEPITAANAPEIIVSTVPAELIVTEGPAAFVPLVDDLLVLQNSDDDVFMHVSSQNYYIVLAGRWYRSGSLNGPWSYQVADELPVAFANIPNDSEQADSRVYVAGTEEANDAVLDAYVPQTAAVTRGEVDIEVKYDGEPIYAPVDGTGLVYIENTGSTVLKANGWYYLVEDGVWYVSASANGPWQVSDHRPQQIDTILPSSPVYNVKYVHVYDSTPEVVYVGYTPGYFGSYVYRNTIFYGTGWYYRPWISPYYYYPRHSTWGFHAAYNPWSGWNFGLSWGWGPFSVSYYSGGYWHHHHHWHHRHYGHWGPRGYRHRPSHYYHGRNHYSHNRHHRDRYAGTDHRRGDYGRGDYGRGDNRRDSHYRDNYYRDPGGDRWSRSNERNDNLYRDRGQRAGIADTRDKRARQADKRAGNSRQAKYVSASNMKQKNYTGMKKREYNRAGPVSSTDMRRKADVRDANSSAKLDRLLADNNGNVYRRTALSSAPPVNNGRTGKPSFSNARDRGITSPPASTSARQSQARKPANTRQKISPVATTSPARVERKSSDVTRQTTSKSVRAGSQQPQPRKPSTTRQRTSPVTANNAPQVQRRVSDSGRQASSKAYRARSQQPQQKMYSNNRQQTTRVASAPSRSQSHSRSAPSPKSSRQASAPTRSKAQKSPHKSSKQRNNSRTGGNKAKRNSSSRNRD